MATGAQHWTCADHQIRPQPCMERPLVAESASSVGGCVPLPSTASFTSPCDPRTHSSTSQGTARCGGTHPPAHHNISDAHNFLDQPFQTALPWPRSSKRQPFPFRTGCHFSRDPVHSLAPVPSPSSPRPLRCSTALHHMLCCKQLAKSMSLRCQHPHHHVRAKKCRFAGTAHPLLPFHITHSLDGRSQRATRCCSGCPSLSSRRLILCHATRASCLWPRVMPRQSPIESLMVWHGIALHGSLSS